jgi:hypothetical protein
MYPVLCPLVLQRLQWLLSSGAYKRLLCKYLQSSVIIEAVYEYQLELLQY